MIVNYSNGILSRDIVLDLMVNFSNDLILKSTTVPRHKVPESHTKFSQTRVYLKINEMFKIH